MFAKCFDDACLLSSSICGEVGTCRLYEKSTLAMNITILLSSVKVRVESKLFWFFYWVWVNMLFAVCRCDFRRIGAVFHWKAETRFAQIRRWYGTRKRISRQERKSSTDMIVTMTNIIYAVQYCTSCWPPDGVTKLSRHIRWWCHNNSGWLCHILSFWDVYVDG